MGTDIGLNGAGTLVNGSSAAVAHPSTAQRTVLKFGGTVCGRLPFEVAQICLHAISKGPIAVICSARSGKTKAEGTTNLLLKAAREASKSNNEIWQQLLDQVLSQHRDTTQVLSQERASELLLAFKDEISKLESLLLDITKARMLLPDLEDRVMGVGERLSAQFLTALLEDLGISSTYLDLSSIVDFDASKGLDESFYVHISPLIEQKILGCQSSIPVITGFFGRVPGGLLKDCGRGYSDVLAAIVAAAVGGKELQIWKEVSGVFTADPSKVPTATLIPFVHPSEARELTFYGSEVIHHLTMDICMAKHIPIRIKNARDPAGHGTLIKPHNHQKLDYLIEYRPRKPTAVTVKDSITVVNVHSNRKSSSPEFLEQICKILRQRCLSVDLFELNETHVSLAVHSKSPFITMRGKKDKSEIDEQHLDLQAAISDLGRFGEVDPRPDMAILSLIGMGLKNSSGIAAKFFSALGNNFINIEMISQGASEINISCVIKEKEALRALSIVHTELFTFME